MSISVQQEQIFPKYQPICLHVEQKLNKIFDLGDKKGTDKLFSASKDHRLHHTIDFFENHNKTHFQTNKIGKRTSDSTHQIFRNNSKAYIFSKTKKNGFYKILQKDYKSLNLSRIKPSNHSSSKSRLSFIKITNPQFQQQKKLVSKILKQIKVFFDSYITQGPLIEWIQLYCLRQKLILQRIILRLKTKQENLWQINQNQQDICDKLQIKQKDDFLGKYRFINLKQLQQLSQYLQVLYEEKTKTKLKEFSRSIIKHMKNICYKIRKEQDNEFIFPIRKKPSQIEHFSRDIKQFQSNYGPLKKITNMNRLRFKLINDNDKQIRKQTNTINLSNNQSKLSNTCIQ